MKDEHGDLPCDSYEVPRPGSSRIETERVGLVIVHGFTIGTRHSDGRLILSRRHPRISARGYLEGAMLFKEGYLTLRCWAEVFVEWRDGGYTAVEDDEIRALVYGFLEQALEVSGTGEKARLVPFAVGPRDVDAVLDALRSLAHLPASATPPAWLSAECQPVHRSLIAFKDTLLDIVTGETLLASPEYFTLSALPFGYTPEVPQPERWLAFLHELWGDDAESIRTLRQWMGYLLTADTRQQKMLLLHGPRRAGKGTIARIIRALVGEANVTSPIVSQLAGSFGLEPLVGKSVAIVSDARFRGRDMSRVIEILLCISGEDAVSVARKFRSALELKLPTRFVFLTDELPTFPDSSEALPGRFIVLRLTRSFYGDEDVGLTDALLDELPGILAWAIEGLRDLYQCGSFIQPQSGSGLVEDMEDLASPVGAFVRECCQTAPGLRVPRDVLFQAWREWCRERGLEHGAESDFGKDLRAAVPGIGDRRPRTEDGRPRCYTGIELGPGWSMDTHMHARGKKRTLVVGIQ